MKTCTYYDRALARYQSMFHFQFPSLDMKKISQVSTCKPADARRTARIELEVVHM